MRRANRPALSRHAAGMSLALLLAVPALTIPNPQYCAIEVLRDYELVFAYYAVVHLAASCPVAGSARVRKSSLTNVKANGRYQPINPVKGAWNVYRNSDTIPNAAQFTFNSWEWQYYDGTRWQSVLAQ